MYTLVGRDISDGQWLLVLLFDRFCRWCKERRSLCWTWNASEASLTRVYRYYDGSNLGCSLKIVSGNRDHDGTG